MWNLKATINNMHKKFFSYDSYYYVKVNYYIPNYIFKIDKQMINSLKY